MQFLTDASEGEGARDAMNQTGSSSFFRSLQGGGESGTDGGDESEFEIERIPDPGLPSSSKAPDFATCDLSGRSRAIWINYFAKTPHFPSPS